MIRRGVLALVGGWLARLRYPWLFAFAALLLGVDLVVPDMIPFADELLLTAVTLMLGSRKKRGGHDDGSDGSPEGQDGGHGGGPDGDPASGRTR